jgi:hypothetical protein
MHGYGKREGTREALGAPHAEAGSPGKRTLTGLDAGSEGAALPTGPRGRFEASLGADLANVRVHDGAASQAAATQLGARAFAVGRDIHFAAGQLQPDTPAGLHLLAHEVAHTVQQGGGQPRVQAKRDVSQVGDAAEIEADRFADHIVHGGAMPALSPAPAMIQRQEATETPTATGESADAAYNTAVTAIIRDILEGYQHIQINVPAEPAPAGAEPPAEATHEAPEATPAPPASPIVVEVSTPYWNNKYPDYNPDGPVDPINNPVPPIGFDNTARGLASFDLPDRSAMAAPAAVAKGSPAEITAMVQTAVDSRLIRATVPSDATPGDDAWQAAWKAAIQAWMVQIGIGVDCNGLVYQAMLRVQRDPDLGARTTGQAGEDNGALDWHLGNVTGVTTESLGGVATDDIPALGEDISAFELRPGDAMYIPGHVRIIMEVRSNDGAIIEFTTAESTVDGRFGEGETYEGPRMHHWKYDGSILWRRHEKSTDADWTDSGEDPRYCRHLMPPAVGT